MPRRGSAPSGLPVLSESKLEKQRMALELRRAKLSYDAIAKQLGYVNATSARRAVYTAIRLVIREPAEEVLQMELDNLDRMQASIWPQAIQGDLDAQARVLTIMDRRAKYLGLMQPEIVQQMVIVSTPEDKELADILAESRVRQRVIEGELDDNADN
jgi:hypothetical protein